MNEWIAITDKLAWLPQYAETVPLENAYSLAKATTPMDFHSPPKGNVDFAQIRSWKQPKYHRVVVFIEKKVIYDSSFP